MRRLKVLHVHHWGERGGSSTSLTHLLRRLDPARHELELVLATDGPVKEDFERLGVPVTVMPMPLVMETPPCPTFSIQKLGNVRGFDAHEGFRRLLAERRPDLVHVSDTPMQSAARTAREAGVPVVWHLRGVIQDRTFSYIRRRMAANIVRTSTRFIGVTEQETDQFGPAPHGVTIYNSVDFATIDRHRGSGGAFRREIGAGPDEVLVGAPIHLTAAKGAYDFLQAAGTVARSCGRRVRFVIAGHWPGRYRRHQLRQWTGGLLGPEHGVDRARRVAREAGVADQVVLTGFRPDVFSVMDALDVVVFPSRLGSVGRAAIEGSALGKPTIATVPNQRTGLVVHERTGLIARPADPLDLARAISRLVEDDDLRRRLGEAGAAYARENFDAEANARKVEAVYDEVMQDRAAVGQPPGARGGTPPLPEALQKDLS